MLSQYGALDAQLLRRLPESEEEGRMRSFGCDRRQVVKVPPAANCSHFPRCRALNLSGACCPVQSGENLGCCFSAPANSSFWKTVTLQPTLPPLPTP